MQIVITEDGSSSVYLPELNEHYHSTHGAIQESAHVFIENGLKKIIGDQIVILEIGFGTGLNALLSLQYAIKNNLRISYYSLEKFPVDQSIWRQLNFAELLNDHLAVQFEKLHTCNWETMVSIHPNFEIMKVKTDLVDFSAEPDFYDLIFFDAFGPDKQPEMWIESHLQMLFHSQKSQGVFTTYCAKGEVRRRLQRSGYVVSRLPGPPGKREMLNGVKP